MRSTAPPSRKAGHVGSLSGHVAQITELRTLSWSSGAAHPPRGTSRFPPSLRRSTASKSRFLNPLVFAWSAQLNHPYTSPTRGRASSPRGSVTVPQSRSQGQAPSAPRAGSPCCPCACGAGAAPRPPPAEAIRAGSALGAGGGAGWCRRRGRCCRGGGGGGGGGGCGGPASVGCRGGCTSSAARPAAGASRPPPPSLRPALPPGSHAPSRLSPGARGALALALGPPSGPLPVPWVPPPVTHALACPLAHRPSLCSLHLGALPAPLAPSRALAPSWPPALSRAVRCPRSAPLRCCALAPCRACPGPLLARAPGHFPCHLLSPAPRSSGWHTALPARRPLRPGSRAGRPAAFAAAAA